jgi:hypothetical protein
VLSGKLEPFYREEVPMAKRSKAEWGVLFEAQAHSGLSAAAFCREQGLCPKYFGRRRRELSSVVVKPTPAFVAVKLPAAGGEGIELRRGEWRCRLPASLPAAYVAALLKAL